MDDSLLERLCRLSALSLSKEERERVRVDLKNTLSHFEKIRDIDTKEVLPLINPLNPPLRLREDQPEKTLDREKVLQEAPLREEYLFKVPPVL